jgi:3-hydroxyisobutyrate dehydrogenase
MCGHLLSAGFSMTVYSRSKEKARGLIERGAKWAASPREVAQNSDIVFSMVSFPRDVRSVLLCPKDGVLAGSAAGSVIVDMTTSEPSLAQEIYSAAKGQGVDALDAPVSGGDKGAREGTLSIMIGGDREVADALQPCWQSMGKVFVYQGPAGNGQHTKMVNQTLVAGCMIGVCEALIYGYRAGLNMETVLQSVSSGAAGSWSLSNLAPRIMGNDFEPGFFVEHFVKDMGIVLAESRRMKLSLPGLALVDQLYQSVQAKGWSKKGTHALTLALAEMSGFDWLKR